MKYHQKNIKTYTISWLTYCFLIAIAIFGINFFIDPLWYNDGNKITKKNYAYNERLSKTNYFLNHMDQYDCVLLGSSVSIVFDTKLIKGSECYNFSVSAGGLYEYTAYLKYLKSIGFSPKKIYIEVNFGFVKPTYDLSRLPNFIKSFNEPDSIYKSYTSIDSLTFSLKNLMGLSPYQHMYDQNFVALTRKDLIFPFSPKVDYLYRSPAEPPSHEVLKLYKELINIFPESIYIGYVYPQSPWITSMYYTHNYLDQNLDIILSLSSFFDEFYDFSFPVDYLENNKITYDGSHFYEFVFIEIARMLNENQGVIGVRINDTPNYKQLYFKNIKSFIKSKSE